jgi:hypothetical protein
MNSHFIARRIENSCDILGSSEKLETMGFHNIMGYVSIIKELNEMEVLEVFYIIEHLISMDKIYKKFAYHLINDNVLSERFFEVDVEFNPTKNNLNYLLGNSEYKEKTKEEKELESYYKDIEESKFEKVYQEIMSKNLNDKAIEKILKNEHNQKLLEFSKTIDQNIVNWLNQNLKKMTYEEFGNFMALITKIRENG